METSIGWNVLLAKVVAFALRVSGGTALLFAPQLASAYLELNLFYNSQALATDSTTNSTQTFIEGALGFSVDKKGDYLIGWNYSLMTTSDSTGSGTVQYASNQMGPRFVMMLDKNKNWSVGVGYYLVTSATFDDGSGSSEKWKGTAIKVDVGYNYAVSESFFFGVRLNYSIATYAEKLIGETDYSTISYTKNLIYPSLSTLFLF